MTQVMSRRNFLTTAAAACLAAPGRAGAPETSLRPALRPDGWHRQAIPGAEALIAKARIGGETAFAVADVRTGQMLEAHNAALALPPASVAKALTACYALRALGPGHHFRTRVLAPTGVADGVVAGDLILAGGGDPTLDTDGLAELAARVKAAGVREVRGRLLVWGGALPYQRGIDADQPDHVGYNPAVSGLNLNFNRVHFEWRRASGAWNVTMDARSDKYRPDVRVARMEIVARDAPVYTYSDAGSSDSWTVARGALGSGGARWLPVRKPEIYAGEVFQTFLRSQGIVTPAPQVTDNAPQGTEIATFDSPPLRVILRDMLKYSTNLTAEAVGMAATRALGGSAATLAQSAARMNQWAQDVLGLADVALVDHSGLGDRSRISAGAMTAALLEARRQIGLKPLLKDIPLRDGATIAVRAKTGTLNFVSGLAGFLDAPDGTEMAFAIFSADTARRDGLSRAERERPRGASGWNTQAKTLQLNLLDRWGAMYGS